MKTSHRQYVLDNMLRLPQASKLFVTPTFDRNVDIGCSDAARPNIPPQLRETSVGTIGRRRNDLGTGGAQLRSSLIFAMNQGAH